VLKQDRQKGDTAVRRDKAAVTALQGGPLGIEAFFDKALVCISEVA
jgi:hypothetical protein